MNRVCITKLLSPGSLISLRVHDDTYWSLNILYRCIEDELDIPLTSDLFNHCIFINSNITIKYRNEYFEYLIYGSISKIDLCGLPYIRIKIQNIFQTKNNRMFPRQDVHFPANLSMPGSNIYFCMVSNISLGGLSFVTNQDLYSNLECEINIYLDEITSIYAKGNINRCNYKNSLSEFSMQFTYMNEDNSNTLYNFLHSIDRSYDELRDKYLSESMTKIG